MSTPYDPALLRHLSDLVQKSAKWPTTPKILGNHNGAAYYECPACGGEGTIDSEHVFTRHVGTYGVQVYGIGEDMSALDVLIPELLEHFPIMVKRLQEVEEHHARLRAFTDWMLDYMQEGGDMDGGTFQDNAERLGILVETRPTEPCGEGCVCAEVYGPEEFTQGEVKCFLRSTLVGGTETPPPAPCAACQGGGLAITGDHGAGCPVCGKVG